MIFKNYKQICNINNQFKSIFKVKIRYYPDDYKNFFDLKQYS